jgi:hypothetical protein
MQLFHAGNAYFDKGSVVQDHLLHNILQHLVHDNNIIYTYI